MKYMILGGRGFIGTNLVDMLRRASNQNEIVVVDNDNENNQWYYGCKLHGVQLVDADLRMSSTLRMLVQEHQPDAIVHLAGNTRVMDSIREPEQFILANHDIDINVAAHVPHGVPVIYASTLGALFPQRSLGCRFNENHATRPATPYGAAKAAGEALFSTYSNLVGFPLGIVRLTNVYGPWSYHKKSVLHRWMRVVTMPWCEEEAVLKDPEHWRDFVYVEDVCKAILAVLGQFTDGNATNVKALYHVGFGKSYSMAQVANIFSGTVSPLAFAGCGGAHELEAGFVGANTNRMKGELGILPMRLEVGLKRTHRWYLTLAGAADTAAREEGACVNG